MGKAEGRLEGSGTAWNLVDARGRVGGDGAG